jgi:hypothetical protein
MVAKLVTAGIAGGLTGAFLGHEFGWWGIALTIPVALILAALVANLGPR